MNQTVERQKPYEHFLCDGPECLSDEELLAIMIRTGHKGGDALSVAHELLKLCGKNGLLGLHHLSLEDLCNIQGIGEVKAVRIKCIAELSNRIVRQSRSKNPVFSSPDLVAEYYMEQMRHLEKEHCVCVMLDGGMGFMGESLISVGSVNASVFSTREIFLAALKAKAVYIMLLHNHPSGLVNPSQADILVTKKLKEASVIMDIPMVDHIIIGDHCYYSFKEHQMI